MTIRLSRRQLLQGLAAAFGATAVQPLTFAVETIVRRVPEITRIPLGHLQPFVDSKAGDFFSVTLQGSPHRLLAIFDGVECYTIQRGEHYVLMDDVRADVFASGLLPYINLP